MKLRFTKMQGAGNDFIVIDGIGQRFEPDPARVRALADRRFGVGADQILVVERAPDAGADFRYRIFNADGGEVEQCGNGARCFVKFVRERGLTDRRSIRVLTAGGLIEPRLEDDGDVTVDMGAPSFDPAASGFDPGGLTPRREGQATLWPLTLGGHDAWVGVVSMGNPHAVQIVEDVERAPVGADGPAIEHHARFANRVNAGFMQVVDRHAVRLRVWERGAGETLACGTGACAAAVAGIARGRLATPVRVHARGGDLRIAWAGFGASGAAPVYMTGPAVKVFDGEIDIR
jgi:diaminopimelate epimerase